MFNYKSKSKSNNIMYFYSKFKKTKKIFQAFSKDFTDLISYYAYLFTMSYTNSLDRTDDKFVFFDKEAINREIKKRYFGDEIINEDYGDFLNEITDLIKGNSEGIREEDEDEEADNNNVKNPQEIKPVENNNLLNSLNILGGAVKHTVTKESEGVKKKKTFVEELLGDNLSSKKESEALLKKTMQNPNSTKSRLMNSLKGKDSRVTFSNIPPKVNEFYIGYIDRLNFHYTGHGVLTNKQKTVYNGMFKLNKKCGIGISYEYRETSCTYYRGQFFNNEPNGFGVRFRVGDDEKILEEGVFENGVFKRGLHLKFHKDTSTSNFVISKYHGSIFRDKSGIEYYNGYGKLYQLTFQKSEIDKKYEEKERYEFVGNFVNSLPQGKGECIKTDILNKYQERYKGMFIDGKKNDDNGYITFEEGFYLKSYKGGFVNDKYFCNYGKVEFSSGDTYEGFFDKDHGKSKVGLYCHYDKNDDTRKVHFFGEFFNDRKHGLGKFIMKDGSMTVGNYVDGEKNGNFELISSINEVGVKNDYRPKPLLNLGAKAKKLSDVDKEKKVRKKKYFLFENDEPIDTSDKPIKY